MRLQFRPKDFRVTASNFQFIECKMENLSEKYQTEFLNEALEQDNIIEKAGQVLSRRSVSRPWWISARWGWHSFNYRNNSKQGTSSGQEFSSTDKPKLVRKIIPAPRA